MKRWVCLFLYPILTLTLSAKEAKHLDLVKMVTGSLVEGSITKRTETHLTFETVSGHVVLPFSSIEKLVEAQPGESELVLGLQLMKREKFDRAKFFLEKALRYSDWHKDAKQQIEAMQQKKIESERERREQEQREIERIIQRKGLKEGVAVLQRRHQYNSENEYWGSYRGKIHLLMAKERLDHLDVRGAERHLQLAEKYGADPDKWNKVRQEIVDFRASRLIFSDKTLAKRRGVEKPQQETEPSDWLAAADTARSKGERIPPKQWLQWVDHYSKQNQLDPLLVWAMIDVESSWRKDVVSHAGAQGLMQLMPETAVDMDVSNPFNPQENIKGGTQYMRFLLEIFNDTDKALAAYNIGPGRLERLGKITGAGARYVNKVRNRYAALKQQYAKKTVSSL